MPKNAPNALVRYLNMIEGHGSGVVTDQVLLERFVRQHDEAAFTSLVDRHGSTVLSVCQRALDDEHLAQDVFQATFLVLVRNAATIRKRSSLAGWLHGVALRLSRKARADSMRAGRGDDRFVPEALPDPSIEVSWREVRKILDEELQRLPEKYRLPLILCYLHGRTRDEAAAELGWTAGQLKGILERGRNRLRQRLIQRGLTPSAAGALLLSETVLAAPLPPQLCVATLRSALEMTMGKGHHVCGLSASVSRLVEGGTKVMGTRKIVMNVLFALGLGFIGTGTFLWAQQPRKQVENSTSPPSVARTEPEKQLEQPNTEDGKPRKAEDEKPRAKNDGPQLKYEFAIDPTQPAGAAILLKLTETNIGKEPMRFWWGGPDDYCALGEPMKVKVTDANGKTHFAQMSNGGALGGSGIHKTLEVGASMVTPAVIAPLPKGSYLLEFDGASARIKVEEDAELLKKHDEELVARVIKGEYFARHVFDTYPTQSHFDICLGKLSSDDVDTAVHYAWLLEQHHKLPASAVRVIARAFDKWFTQPKGQARWYALGSLADLASRIGTDEALELVLKVNSNPESQGMCIGALGLFKQDRARKKLYALLNNKDEDWRFSAAATLAKNGDKASFDVLVAIAEDTKSALRVKACYYLAYFPSEARAEAAIRSCIAVPHLADEARSALKRLEEARKKTN